jgi:hypothetical protein
LFDPTLKRTRRRITRLKKKHEERWSQIRLRLDRIEKSMRGISYENLDKRRAEEDYR